MERLALVCLLATTVVGLHAQTDASSAATQSTLVSDRPGPNLQVGVSVDLLEW